LKNVTVNNDKKFSTIAAISIIIITGILVYLNSLHNAFQFDDIPNIIENDHINSFSRFTSLSYWAEIYHRPLPTFISTINYFFSGTDTFLYHIINLIIHLMTSITAYFFTLQIFKSPVLKTNKLTSYKYIIALFSALIFLCHPLQTQSVTYIIQRIEALAGLFYILACHNYLKARMLMFTSDNRKTYIKPLIFFGLASIAGILTKQTFASLPVSLLLLEIFFVRNKKNETNKKYITSFLSALILIFVTIAVLGMLPKERDNLSRIDYLFSQFQVIPKYIQLMFFPISQNLDYDYRLVDTIWNLKSSGGLLIIIATIFTAVKLFRKHILISFGICWFYATIFLRSSIFPIRDLIYEHRVYTPLYGFALLLTVSIISLCMKYKSNNKRAIPITLTLIVLVLGSATILRNNTWKTEISLWEDIYAKSPNKERVSYNLGLSYYNAKKYQKAEKYYLKAISLNSAFIRPYHNLATIYMNQKKWDLAIKYFSKANELKGDNENTLYNLATIWFYKEDYDKSEMYYKKALKLKPENHLSYYNLAKIMEHKNNIPAAEKYLLKTLSLKSDYCDALLTLGNIYYYKKDYHKAEDYFSKVVKLEPLRSSIYSNLANIAFMNKQHQKALTYYDKALKIDPNFTGALFNKANVYYMIGQKKKALEYYVKTLKVQPNHQGALKNSQALRKQLH